MKTENNIRLIYFSQSLSSLSKIDIENILLESRQNNEKINVSGILCFGGSDFIQVLEGEESIIISLYAKILKDTRHQSCQLLDIHFADSRLFEKWSMGFVERSKADFEKLHRILNQCKKSNKLASSEITTLLKTYLGSNQ